MGEIRIGSKRYPLVQDSLLPEGKRALVRNLRASNVSDPGRIRRVTWQVSGPIGNSLESVAGQLATDYTTNLETRFDRRLFSLGKRTLVSLASQNPPVLGASTNSMFGTAYFGTSYFGGTQATSGSSSSSGDIVRHITEMQGYLFFDHGAISTQVNPQTWAVIDADVFPAEIKADVHWRTVGFLAFGGAYPTQIRYNTSSSGASYGLTNSAHSSGGTLSTFVRAFAVGSDRLWGIFAEPMDAYDAATNPSGTGWPSKDGQVTYSLDAWLNLAAPFQVGDRYKGGSGIGVFGPFTFFGYDNGIFAVTDQGKPVPLSRALAGHNSANNGSRWADPGWGWAYYISDTGLRATNGAIDNPVGIGERMPAFTGHNGRPTAIHAERGEMWVAYLDGTTGWMYRCTFGPETANTGQPLMYPSRYLTTTEVGAIYSTNITTNTTIVWGEDGDFAYETIDRGGRDDKFSARLYSTDGGVWYGTTLDRDPHLLKTLRMARLRVLNVEPCATWQLAFSFDLDPWDASPDYVDCGPELDVPGYYDLRPTNGPGGAPLPNISGRSIKPRLTQTAEGEHSETLPPEVNGTLEVEYDERPDMIEEVTAILQGGTNTDSLIDTLHEIASEQTNGPTEVTLPGANPGTGKWAMIADVQRRRDLKGDSVEGVEVTLHLWDNS